MITRTRRAAGAAVVAAVLGMVGATAANAASHLRCCYSTSTTCNSVRQTYVKDGSWNVGTCRYYTISDGNHGYGFVYTDR
ncbi:hypothetical protein [Terracoccus sp. 273MFTsu3.1]|uniref:hypothetical protein n=1 Tax=Terracoccus sp. 273MFTsu3.1 TaxID=1172188 RepID=UPI000382AD2F|nr:hypothetical protein [Terracoccus sp. 273MFTsu3.1]